MKVNYKIIGFLALLGLLAALLSLPYVYGLLGDVLIEARLELGLSESIYNAILIGQAAIIYAYCRPHRRAVLPAGRLQSAAA
jgi:hypothetical protein